MGEENPITSRPQSPFRAHLFGFYLCNQIPTASLINYQQNVNFYSDRHLKKLRYCEIWNLFRCGFCFVADDEISIRIILMMVFIENVAHFIRFKWFEISNVIFHCISFWVSSCHRKCRSSIWYGIKSMLEHKTCCMKCNTSRECNHDKWKKKFLPFILQALEKPGTQITHVMNHWPWWRWWWCDKIGENYLNKWNRNKYYFWLNVITFMISEILKSVIRSEHNCNGCAWSVSNCLHMPFVLHIKHFCVSSWPGP